jgi:uncharacterized protein with von Willebrand factor type A (vWA) domain
MTEPAGALVANLMHFARVLRGAGLPIGPGRVLAAVQAVETVGVARREDFYWALHAVMVNRRDQHDVFDHAFRVFWRDPKLTERLMAGLLPELRLPDHAPPDPGSRRVAEAQQRPTGASEPPGEERTLDATLTWSDRELLRTRDFEQMSREELRAARAAIARLRLPIQPIATRRFRPDRRGARIDARASLRAMLRQGGDVITLARRARRARPPPLVVLCDISGSMERYSRMFLHFLHALTNDRDRVHSFLFGTRLTNVTRHLRDKDVDRALDRIAKAVEDWSGGTRIGQCLREFNRRWARRVLGQNATVILISDGLDRDAGEGLAEEAERLNKSCRRLIWLNPLLRYAGFEPRSLGMKAILPHVDDFRPAHNLASLADIARILAQPARRGRLATPPVRRAA